MNEKEPVSIFLKGERISLRPMRSADAARYAAWINDKEIADMLAFHRPITLESENEWLSAALKAKPTEEINLGIWTNEPEELIGNLGLFDMDLRSRRATMGIFIGDAKNFDKGYGSEAIRLLLRYAFDTLNLNKVCLRHLATNERGRACYLKVGFKQAGLQKRHVFSNGEYADVVIMEIFADEFRALYGK